MMQLYLVLPLAGILVRSGTHVVPLFVSRPCLMPYKGLNAFQERKIDDYHKEMDGSRFEGWFNHILRKLPPGCIIVMDNVSYHSMWKEKLPTNIWKKESIQEWLKGKNIAHSKKMLKKQRADLVSSVKLRYISYIVGNTAERAGCIVLRLPPYHCKFNLIEFHRARAKTGFAAENTDVKLLTVKGIPRDKISNLTAEGWTNNIKHVMDLEDKSGSDYV